jgi:hypothetical protein
MMYYEEYWRKGSLSNLRYSADLHVVDLRRKRDTYCTITIQSPGEIRCKLLCTTNVLCETEYKNQVKNVKLFLCLINLSTMP